MGAPRKYSDEQMIAALRETKGMVYLAAERIGCEADTIYLRAKVSPEVAEVMKHERGKVIDVAEMKLYTAIMNAEPWAIQMALRCLGKDRGYFEKQEIDSTNRNILNVTEEIVDAEAGQQNDPAAPDAIRVQEEPGDL